MEHAKFGFGDRLRAARERKGLSGDELGKGAGDRGADARRQSVHDWEKETHYPKVDQLRVLCRRLEVSADELIFGGVPFAPTSEVAKVAREAAKLSPSQRAELGRVLAAQGIPDAKVEKAMPITRIRKAKPV